MFYWEVAQAILLYGSEMWVLLAKMDKKVEGEHMGFLRNIVVKQARRIVYGTWETPGEEVVQETAGT